MKQKQGLIIGIVFIMSAFLTLILVIIQDNTMLKDGYNYEADEELETISTMEPYPKRKETSYFSTGEINKKYSFTVENLDVLDYEKDFPVERMEYILNAVQDYIQNNSFDEKITVLSIMPESVYVYNEQYGLTFCLNTQYLDYVQVDVEGDKIQCRDDIYCEPPALMEEDREYMQKIHNKEDVLYSEHPEYDSYDFPYTESDLVELAKDYYADMSGSYYANYQKYGVPLTKYMPYEIDCFTYLYSTYKFNTDRLKEELAKGNEELQRYGEISAEIQGYRTLYSTQILAKVKLTISYKGISESRYEYVTFIASEDELLLMPEDCSMMDCWDYKYRY